MPVRDLPVRQLAVLRYLDGNGPSRVRDVTSALRRPRADVQNALVLLAGKHLVAARLTVPLTYVITTEGQLVVAYASKAEGGQP